MPMSNAYIKEPLVEQTASIFTESLSRLLSGQVSLVEE